MIKLTTYFFFLAQITNASPANRIDEYYSALAKAREFSGAVYYYKDGQKQFSKFYSDKNRLNEKSVFKIGSLSKPITATAILTLVERKKLDLDAPINKVLTDLKIPDSVTARNLLNHTSGAVYEFTHDVKNEESFRRQLKAMKWEKPGKHVYSNAGYQTLGLVVRAISGMPLYSFVQKEVFAKLPVPPAKNQIEGINSDCGTTSVIRPDNSYAVGSGGSVGTSQAVAEFFIALNENKILSESSKNSMFEDPQKIGYGLGMRVKVVDGQKILNHNGAVPGFKAFVMFNEKRDYLFVFSNLEQFPLIQAEKDAALLFSGKDFAMPVPVKRKEVSLDPKPFKDFVGNYVLDFDANQKLKISFNEKDQHFYILDSGKNSKLIPDAEGSFFTCPTSADSVFFKRVGEKTTLELTSYGGAKFTAAKY